MEIFRNRDMGVRGIIRTVCFRKIIMCFVIVMLFLSIFFSFFVKFGSDELLKIRFHKRRLTLETDLIHSRCNSSHETGTSGISRKPVDLRIFVLTYNRPSSVRRLLKSLNNAIYGNSSVLLEVWVDRSVNGQVDRDTISVLKSFKFDRGGYRVCVQAKHAGILGQWLTGPGKVLIVSGSPKIINPWVHFPRSATAGDINDICLSLTGAILKTQSYVQDNKTVQTVCELYLALHTHLRAKWGIINKQLAPFCHPEHRTGLEGVSEPWKAVESGDHEIAVLLEDDLTVSPYFYTYLKRVHSKYRNSPKINGFSLQGYSMRHWTGNGVYEGNISIDPKELVYLYPTLGTWGFSPNRKNWAMFLRWFEYKYNDKIFNPIVLKHVSSDWYRGHVTEGSEDNFWEVWHIYFAWANQEFTLYPNFVGHRGLTFNWKENGLHFSDQNVMEMDADKNNLLMEWKPDYDILPDDVLAVDNDGSILTRFGHRGLTFNWKENGLHFSDQNVMEMDADKNNLLMEWKPDYDILPDDVLAVDNDGSILTRFGMQ